MVIRKEKEEKILKKECEISVEILKRLKDEIREGATPLQLDTQAGLLCKEYSVKPAFREVEGYSFNTCISVNDVAVHGIPKNIAFKKGDLVSIDFGIIYKDIYTDHCWTWSIGEPTEKNRKLLDAGKEAVERAMMNAVVGKSAGDLGYVMEKVAKQSGFDTLKMFVGHGIGKTLHEDPEIRAFGNRGEGDELVDGMVICVECQVVDDIGSKVTIDNDGWSARTVHGGNSVMFEYMVLVRENTPTILTDTRDWSVVV